MAEHGDIARRGFLKAGASCSSRWASGSSAESALGQAHGTPEANGLTAGAERLSGPDEAVRR